MRVLIILLVGVAEALAQGLIPIAPSPSGSPQTHTAAVEVEPSEEAPTLTNLVQISDVVIEGSVLDVLPAVSVSPQANQPLPPTPEIETHSIVSVISSIIGTVSGGQSKLVVTQVGGHFDDWNFVCADQPFLQAGKRYVLFLKLDKRDNPANTTGYPRYYIAGIWSGLAAVDSRNAIAFATRASASLHASDGTDQVTFAGQLVALAKVWRENRSFSGVNRFATCHMVGGRCENR